MGKAPNPQPFSSPRAAGKKPTAGSWASFEVLVPRPSCSKNGRKMELVLSTAPFVNSVMRTEAYERVASKGHQSAVDDMLSMPKHASTLPESFTPRHPLHELQRPSPRKNQAELMRSGLGFVPPPLPPITRRPTAPKESPRTARENGELGSSAPHTERYSETPFYRRTKQNKIFDLDTSVSRERAVVTSGRAFSWGQGHRMGFAPFNPHRERMLMEGSSKGHL